MVKPKQKFSYLSDGTLDITEWLQHVKHLYHLDNMTQLSEAALFTQKLTQGLTTFYGLPCLEQGLEVAETLLNLKLDQETASAGIISSALTITPQIEESTKKELGETIAKLVSGVRQMHIIPSLQTRNNVQIDKIRKMLLAMATDIRVVIIKLAERLCFMHGIKSILPEEQKRFAQEIFDIYAPLANRLGIGQLKWELEDLAFRYQEPTLYKKIATFLAERRIDREKRIQHLIDDLKAKLVDAKIEGEVTGRAKHIYSIYLKTERKDLNYKDIYDQMAVRILVSSIEDCYTALSIVNSLWPPIMEEFDDYIVNPKPNGYRSIHTAVVGEDGKHFEIQIRTREMHEEAERGVAAHWMYKEKATESQNHAEKITYLRQLLDWHQEISTTNIPSNALNATALLQDQIYVTTPAGDIIDMPHGATPLDFAYHVHSELGHRCRGAKVNGQIVPLTYTLQTGDRVEIISILQGTPSRDWLNPEHGYIKTNRAKNKITHWFKQQALNQDMEAGRQLLERELARSGLTKISLSAIARQLQLKNEEALLVGLGRGNIRIGQLLQALQPKTNAKTIPHITTTTIKSEQRSTALADASDLLTRFAKCCKPIPGDEIIGYITQGRGISIHKTNCTNLKESADSRRFIQIQWNKQSTSLFSTDLKIVAEDQDKILSELTALFANEKISILSFNSTFNKNQSKLFIQVTVQIHDNEQLQRLLHRIQQLPRIIEVSRVKD